MDEKKEKLIKSVKRAVSEYGLSKISTRNISDIANVNDAYIYHFFKDKEELLFQAYIYENDIIYRYMLKQIDTFHEIPISFRERAYNVFVNLWKKILSDCEQINYCVEYYHSNLFKNAEQYHTEQLEELQQRMGKYFPDIESCKQTIYALFTMLYDSAYSIVSGKNTDTEEYMNQVFEMGMAVLKSQMTRIYFFDDNDVGHEMKIGKEEIENLQRYLKKNYRDVEFLDSEILNLLTKKTMANFGSELLSPVIGFNSLIGAGCLPIYSDKEDVKNWIYQQMFSSESFADMLNRLLKEKGYIDSIPEFYRRICIDRRVFSRIASFQNYAQPDKKTVLKLIIGLELNVSESLNLLQSAGYSFNNHKKLDMIVKYCIENKVYDPFLVDEYLSVFGEKTLFVKNCDGI